MTLSDSVYSCADEASSTFTEDQAVYVSPADIAAVKKLTAETVSKKADKDTLDRIAPVINVLANVPLSAEDQTFVDLYSYRQRLLIRSMLKSVYMTIQQQQRELRVHLKMV
jgi:hypothetical protein